MKLACKLSGLPAPTATLVRQCSGPPRLYTPGHRPPTAALTSPPGFGGQSPRITIAKERQVSFATKKLKNLEIKCSCRPLKSPTVSDLILTPSPRLSSEIQQSNRSSCARLSPADRSRGLRGQLMLRARLFAITSPTHNQSTRTTTHGCKILSRCRSAPAVPVRRCDGGSSFSLEEDICATHQGNRQSDPLFHGCSYIFHMSGNNEQLEMTHHCRNSAAVGPPDADTRRRWRRNCTGGRQRVRADRRNRSHLVWGAVRAEMSPALRQNPKTTFRYFLS